MDVRLIPLKIKERLQKLDSSDNLSFECWNYIEAYNKAQLQRVRLILDPLNPFKAGAENNIKNVDDLQVLIKKVNIGGVNNLSEFESKKIPQDYLQFRRADIFATKGACKSQKLIAPLFEEANVGVLLKDHNHRPSFEWRQSFITLAGDRLYSYTDGTFTIDSARLIYYRLPRNINLAGCPDLNGNIGVNIDPELKDDLVEAIIDDAVVILAGDIESINQLQINKKSII
jgi:hypothetical protein